MIFWRKRKGTIIKISPPFLGRQLCVFFLEALLALFRGNHNGGVGVMIRLSSALFFFSQRITIDGCLVCNSAGDWVPETRFLGFGSVQSLHFFSKFCHFWKWIKALRNFEKSSNMAKIWPKKMDKNLLQLTLKVILI